MTYESAAQIQDVLSAAHHIVIIQADNPDGDSLGSALALEHILGDMGKQVSMYCAVDMPSYLQYLTGWDRVSNEMPKQFDASIIVDASTRTLLEKLASAGQLAWMAAKPSIVLDHHEVVENPLEFATITINDAHRSSTGELLYVLAKDLEWPLSLQAQECITSSILGDTQGLSNQMATPETYRIMAAMIEDGVDRPAIEEVRREYSKMPEPIYRYKSALIHRTELNSNGTIASVTVPQVEIKQYSPLYNPAALIQPDMLQITGVAVAIVFKTYDDGHVTAAIRSNPGHGIAASLAEHFGGGGHAFASGFKYHGSKPFDELKAECVTYAQTLLDEHAGK